MPLARGARLGPYRIDAEIGAGGMGHVFRATDTRLDRAVAVKVLPQHRWSDPKIRHRFEREARALSSLSHPNLCALYDVGELTQSGATIPYLVMELLEGETLRDRLQAGRLGVRKALAWGAQIASGLAAAHQKGVVHRDLKPENVFITGGHLLKILDFGLAVTTDTHDSATTAMRTEPGMVMGTAHYMSPEQVRGEPLDVRSDIFSFGIVLFEMLTGRVPFHARSSVETMNAILTDDPPDIGTLVPSIPDTVEALVRRCLEKDPSQRFSSAGDLAFALDSAARSVTSSTPSPAKRRSSAAVPRPSRTRALVLGAILLTVIGAAVLSRRSFEPQQAQPPRMHPLTYSGRDSDPAVSPDGRLIAFVSTRDGRRRIWLKQLADGTEAAVTAGPEDYAPRFSPDSAVLLFSRNERGTRALYRVGVVGGEPRRLIDNAFDGDWSPDGKQLAFIRHRAEPRRFSTICLAPVDGGDVREITATDTEDLSSPRWSPGGNAIAVTRTTRGTNAGSVLVVDLVSGDKKVLSRPEAHGMLSGTAWVNGGRALIYAELDALGSTGLPRPSGSSAIVLHEVDSGEARVLLRNPHSAADRIDVAGDGRIVFSEDLTRQSLQEVTLDGSRPPRWLSRGMSIDRQPSYARGGASVFFASDRGNNVDVWELALDSGSVRRVTDHSGVDWDPYPAGDALFWSSNRGGHFEVWTSALDGASPRQLTRDGVDAENPSLPASGEFLIYDSTNEKTDGLWRIGRDGSGAKMIVAGETIHPHISADGQYVAYQSPKPGGAIGIDVVRLADGKVFTLAGGITGVTTLRARWVADTHTVAFRAPGPNGAIAIFAQEFRPGEDTTATRTQLAAGDGSATPETFTFSADGKRAVIAVVEEASGLMMAEGVAGVTR
ncbi:MAG TPA: protein kinase [Thermoanaerobaculia bacterium]|jgi:serine/threonine protein kinase/dipeptidyl aminopeptidase/acylaminoacyl peptidase